MNQFTMFYPLSMNSAGTIGRGGSVDGQPWKNERTWLVGYRIYRQTGGFLPLAPNMAYIFTHGDPHADVYLPLMFIVWKSFGFILCDKMSRKRKHRQRPYFSTTDFLYSLEEYTLELTVKF